ncbi:HAD family hydrolase [Nocardia tenerifensis]|uniref:HAD family hydrolase n=1 Tax=Nocardia tenerifensis TaxID=228006 RepID=UPI0002FF40C6|nr:HAD family phosphatase [Nocardia tenerifensis]
MLFDLDGTLVDSGPLWDEALAELVESNGGTLGSDILACTHGIDSTAAVALTYEAHGWRDLDVAAGVAWMQNRVIEKLMTKVPLRAGALRLLAEVRSAGIPCGLVTASYRPVVEHILGDLGHFDVVVCGDEIDNTKPHPEPYLTAAERLNVDPVDCVAVEDSPTGIASATEAGCAVLAVPSLSESRVSSPLPEVSVEQLEQLLGGNRSRAFAKVSAV